MPSHGRFWPNSNMTVTIHNAVAVSPVAGSLQNMAASAAPDRNRAIDFYRAIAMALVAVGHWMATAVGTDADGNLIAGNALEFAPELAILSWLFQVMPLFFVVGGFASAMSLDSFWRNTPTGRAQDWVVSRLRRMLAPAVVLASVWLAALAVGSALGFSSLIATGATAAAIPLWFLANYTIDTAIAPLVLPLFRRFPRGLPAVGVAVFCAIEVARFAQIPVVPQFNWVLGWLVFQVAGFAWRDDLLPGTTTMAAMAVGLWATAIAVVTLGPWPAAMVHFPGLENSPTHPPSLALMLFGAAYSATAIALAPPITAWLAQSTRAWTLVVGANSVAMSVYLWHFTAIIIATAVLLPFNMLPTAAVNSGAWWLQKLPVMALAAVSLTAIVAAVASVERRALLAPRQNWNGSPVSLFATAAVLSIVLKQWAHGAVLPMTCSMIVLLALWHGVVKTRDSGPVR